MPYDVKDSTGKVVATFENPPSQQDLEDLDAHLGGTQPQSANQTPGGIGGALIKAGDWMEGIRPSLAKGVAKVADYALPTAGAIAADVMAAPAIAASGPVAPATAALSTTAGLMAGKSGARGLRQLLGLEQDPGLAEEAKKSYFQDLPNSTAETTTGMLTGAALTGAKNAIVNKLANSDLRRSLVASAFKPSTAKKLDIRDANIDTILKEGITPNREGYDKTYTALDDLVNQGKGNIADAMDAGKVANKTNVVMKARDVYDKFSDQVTPGSDIEVIKKGVQDFINHPKLPSQEIPLDVAQALKQGTYRQLKNKYGQLGSADVETQKALARGLKEEIATQVPEMSDINAREGAILNALPTIERAIARIENRDLAGISTNIATGAGKALTGSRLGAATMGTVKSIMDSPVLKTKFAIALDEARRNPSINPYSNLSKLLNIE